MFNFMSLINIIIGVPVTLIALSGHELAHAWVSTKLGDPTPGNTGRLTLNPLAHLDLIGTLLMVLTGFGWAKPVQINPAYYKDRKKGTALVAIAGPLANFLMAFAGMIIGALLMVLFSKLNMQSAYSFTSTVTYYFVFRNLCFMVFNIIPIPPLDGSKVLGMFLPNNVYYKMLEYERYIMILLMVLCLTGFFSRIIGTGVDVVYGLMANAVNHLLALIV